MMGKIRIRKTLAVMVITLIMILFAGSFRLPADAVAAEKDRLNTGGDPIPQQQPLNATEDTTVQIEEAADKREEESKSKFSRDDWKLLLVNKQHPVPKDHTFDLGTITPGMQCDARIIPEVQAMLKAAKADGIQLIICSPYRDESRQTQLFERKIRHYMAQGQSYMEAYKNTSQIVTIPGASEHQIGLALDIISNLYTVLDEGFGKTAAGIWLEENCSEYGFILRYPEGKEGITGIDYEPWHFRYVGREAAKIIMENKLTLEEFVESIS